MIEERLNKELLLIGMNIKRLRKELNISQLELGIIMNMDRSEISKYENGKLSIEVRTLIRFAEAFRVDTKEILDFDKLLVQ